MSFNIGRIKNKKGFTLTEVMFAAVISAVVIGVVVSTWLYTYKTWSVQSEKTHLRVGLMETLETIKNDIRLSSLTYMAFYPSATQPHVAISLPTAEKDSDGFFTVDSNGEIVWDNTVIYHLFTETDNTVSLRRTVIPRDNSLTEEERYDELSDVVITGGSETTGSNTEILLAGVSTFEVSSLAPVIEFYADSTIAQRVGKIVFGWIKLSSGEHTVKFEVTGRNDDSTGYDIGLDKIMIEPSGSGRDMEYYASSYAPSGALTVNDGTCSRVHGSVWTNCNYLLLSADTIGSYLEINDDYDLWRESAFETVTLNNANKIDEEVMVALDAPEDDEQGDTIWDANTEAGDSQQEGRDGVFETLESTSGITSLTIRTVVRSNNIAMATSLASGDYVLVRTNFKASTSTPVTISRAYITARNGTSGFDGLANQAPASLAVEEYHRHQQLFFYDSTLGVVSEGITVPAGTEAWSLWTAFPVRNTSDYLISFYIADATGLVCKYWGGDDTTIRSYYLAGDYPYAAGIPDWTTSAYVPETNVLGSYNVYICASVDSWFAKGEVESNIFDTTLENPSYGSIKWSESLPTGKITDVVLKARSSDDEQMTGATAWDSITGTSVSGDTLSIGTGRYVQFKGYLSAAPYWYNTTSDLSYKDYVTAQVALDAYQFPATGDFMRTALPVPKLDDVEIDWPGSERICTITGYIARKNDYGQAKLTIDGQDLVRVLGVKVGLTENIQGREIVEQNIVEMEPRNTGK
ncbi:MAG TPA: prepilin-type N-terminal cleavage/methylation domain-containing protein [Candidatus Omnitrophota bacterium]|nr:prepilin-type N-terminal cleavage/methylation domain-containing protein [Candidatus Omnitrophota bacterium]